MANILALDQSSHTTGYAVFQDGKPVVISHFEANGQDIGERLHSIRKTVLGLIQKYSINEIVLEDIQLQDMHGNKEVGITTFKMLAEVLGSLIELFAEMGIKYTPVPPIVWKATFKIAGKGRTQEKKMAQEYVLKAYGLKCTEDEADATCIGAHYILLTETEFDWS